MVFNRKKLQALEQLLEEQLDSYHIEETTSLLILLYLLLRRNLKMENGDRFKSCQQGK